MILLLQFCDGNNTFHYIYSIFSIESKVLKAKKKTRNKSIGYYVNKI